MKNTDLKEQIYKEEHMEGSNQILIPLSTNQLYLFMGILTLQSVLPTGKLDGLNQSNISLPKDIQRVSFMQQHGVLEIHLNPRNKPTARNT